MLYTKQWLEFNIRKALEESKILRFPLMENEVKFCFQELPCDTPHLVLSIVGLGSLLYVKISCT